MEVALKHIEKLFTASEFKSIQFDLSDLKFANSFKINAGSIEFQRQIDQPYLELLKEKNIQKIAVCLDKQILNKLRVLFSRDYPTYQFEEEIPTIRRRLEFVERMNQYCKIQRKLILRQEIIKTLGNKQEIILRIGDPINEVNLKKIIAVAGSDYKVQYSYNEEGVLVFIDEPVKNVILRIDVLALLSQTSYPIVYVETLDEAVDAFIEKRPRITIMTHLEKAWESKALFLECYKRDPFFKYLNYNVSPTKNRDEEISRLVALYNDDYEDAVENYIIQRNLNRPNLEAKMRNPIMDKIEYVRKNYSKKNFVEMSYYLYKLGQKYNVKTLDNILSKING